MPPRPADHVSVVFADLFSVVKLLRALEAAAMAAPCVALDAAGPNSLPQCDALNLVSDRLSCFSQAGLHVPARKVGRGAAMLARAAGAQPQLALPQRSSCAATVSAALPLPSSPKATADQHGSAAPLERSPFDAPTPTAAPAPDQHSRPPGGRSRGALMLSRKATPRTLPFGCSPRAQVIDAIVRESAGASPLAPADPDGAPPAHSSDRATRIGDACDAHGMSGTPPGLDADASCATMFEATSPTNHAAMPQHEPNSAVSGGRGSSAHHTESDQFHSGNPGCTAGGAEPAHRVPQPGAADVNTSNAGFESHDADSAHGRKDGPAAAMQIVHHNLTPCSSELSAPDRDDPPSRTQSQTSPMRAASPAVAQSCAPSSAASGPQPAGRTEQAAARSQGAVHSNSACELDSFDGTERPAVSWRAASPAAHGHATSTPRWHSSSRAAAVHTVAASAAVEWVPASLRVSAATSPGQAEPALTHLGHSQTGAAGALQQARQGAVDSQAQPADCSSEAASAMRACTPAPEGGEAPVVIDLLSSDDEGAGGGSVEIAADAAAPCERRDSRAGSTDRVPAGGGDVPAPAEQIQSLGTCTRPVAEPFSSPSCGAEPDCAHSDDIAQTARFVPALTSTQGDGGTPTMQVGPASAAGAAASDPACPVQPQHVAAGGARIHSAQPDADGPASGGKSTSKPAASSQGVRSTCAEHARGGSIIDSRGDGSVSSAGSDVQSTKSPEARNTQFGVQTEGKPETAVLQAPGAEPCAAYDRAMAVLDPPTHAPAPCAAGHASAEVLAAPSAAAAQPDSGANSTAEGSQPGPPQVTSPARLTHSSANARPPTVERSEHGRHASALVLQSRAGNVYSASPDVSAVDAASPAVSASPRPRARALSPETELLDDRGAYRGAVPCAALHLPLAPAAGAKERSPLTAESPPARSGVSAPELQEPARLVASRAGAEQQQAFVQRGSGRDTCTVAEVARHADADQQRAPWLQREALPGHATTEPMHAAAQPSSPSRPVEPPRLQLPGSEPSKAARASACCPASELPCLQPPLHDVTRESATPRLGSPCIDSSISTLEESSACLATLLHSPHQVAQPTSLWALDESVPGAAAQLLPGAPHGDSAECLRSLLKDSPRSTAAEATQSRCSPPLEHSSELTERAAEQAAGMNALPAAAPSPHVRPSSGAMQRRADVTPECVGQADSPPTRRSSQVCAHSHFSVGACSYLRLTTSSHLMLAFSIDVLNS